jgi:hypothetical protein
MRATLSCRPLGGGRSASPRMTESFDIAANDLAYRNASRITLLLGRIGGPATIASGVALALVGLWLRSPVYVFFGVILAISGYALFQTYRNSSSARWTQLRIDGPEVTVYGGNGSTVSVQAGDRGMWLMLVDYSGSDSDPHHVVPCMLGARGVDCGVSPSAFDALLEWTRNNRLRIEAKEFGQTRRYDIRASSTIHYPFVP